MSDDDVYMFVNEDNESVLAQCVHIVGELPILRAIKGCVSIVGLEGVEDQLKEHAENIFDKGEGHYLIRLWLEHDSDDYGAWNWWEYEQLLFEPESFTEQADV